MAQRDLLAYRAAKGPAIVAMRRLFHVLADPSSSPADVANAARAAHSATGSLWETAARVDE